MQVGCQENKSDPGFARYMINPVNATDIICTTMLIQNQPNKLTNLCNQHKTNYPNLSLMVFSMLNVITNENLSNGVLSCMEHNFSYTQCTEQAIIIHIPRLLGGVGMQPGGFLTETKTMRYFHDMVDKMILKRDR